MYRAVYIERNARLQAQAYALGEPEFLNDEAAEKSIATLDATMSRAWDLWCSEIGSID